MNRRGFFGAVAASMAGAAAAIAGRAEPVNDYATVELIESEIDVSMTYWIDLPTGNPMEFVAFPITELDDPAVALAHYEAIRDLNDPALLAAFTDVLTAHRELAASRAEIAAFTRI